jgi:hypothetical protein
MSVSYEVTYVGDGFTRNYAVVPDYIRKSHIQVYLNDVLTTDYVWFNDQVIQFTVAPAVGVAILITRRPPGDEPINTFTGSVLTPTALNENFRQAAQLGVISQDDAAEARTTSTTALQEAQDAKDEADQALVVANLALDRADEAASGVIADGAVTTVKLANGAVTAAKLSGGSVTTEKLTTGAVTELELSASSVTTPKIATGAVTTDKIANEAITSDKLGPQSVTGGKIQWGSITDLELDVNAVGTQNIQPGVVTESKLDTGAVTNNKIGAGAVTSSKLANGAVTPEKLADQAVTTNKLAPSAVTTDTLNADAVTTSKIANEAVTSNKLSPNLVLAGAPTTTSPDPSNDSPRLATTEWVRDVACPLTRFIGANRGLTGGAELTNDIAFSIPTSFIDSGSNWSPTFSGLVNCSDPSLVNGHWTLVDSVVTFSGRIQCTVTSANPVSLVMTIPVNVGGFATVNQCLGNVGGVQANNPVSGSVRAEAGVNRVVLDFTGPSSGTRSVYFTAQYSIS